MSARDASAIGQRVRFSHGRHMDSCNRIELRCDWYDRDLAGVTLSYGNGNSDPVWYVAVEVRRPPRLLRWWADRQWEKERRTS